MSTLEFQPWPKIARLNRDIAITEKIDGTNAAVVIVPLDEILATHEHTASVREDGITVHTVDVPQGVCTVKNDATREVHAVFAQSRTRFITPEDDNYGFAGWVKRNAELLVSTLGAGTHFGEWWGSGIQRKYGLTGNDKRFSLFNTGRWAGGQLEAAGGDLVPGLQVVPVLYEGAFSQTEINGRLMDLAISGSVAAPGFMRPEGIVIWHDAARQSFKVTLENDSAPKGAEGHRFDEERIAA